MLSLRFFSCVQLLPQTFFLVRGTKGLCLRGWVGGGGQGRRRLDGSISSQDMRRRKIGTRKIGRRCLLSHATGN